MCSEQPIWAALRRVVDPCSIAAGTPINLVEMGLVKDVAVDDGTARVVLRVTSPICWQAANIIAAVEEGIGAIPGIRSVTCTIDAGCDWMPSMMAPDAQARLRRLRPLAEIGK
jgi:metal-sulfur cluster biosynthetic enzyme